MSTKILVANFGFEGKDCARTVVDSSCFHLLHYRSDSSEKMRHQLESTKALHKAELEKLNHKLREEQSRAQKMTQKVRLISGHTL